MKEKIILETLAQSIRSGKLKLEDLSIEWQNKVNEILELEDDD